MTPFANHECRPGDTSTLPQDSDLRELLKRCPASTYEAACALRRTGNPVHVPVVVAGVIAHHVEPGLRAKLHAPDESLRLIEDLGLDSLTLMEVAMLAEDVLRISISNEDLTSLRTLGDVIRLVSCRVRDLPAPPPAPRLAGGWVLPRGQSQPS